MACLGSCHCPHFSCCVRRAESSHDPNCPSSSWGSSLLQWAPSPGLSGLKLLPVWTEEILLLGVELQSITGLSPECESTVKVLKGVRWTFLSLRDLEGRTRNLACVHPSTKVVSSQTREGVLPRPLKAAHRHLLPLSPSCSTMLSLSFPFSCQSHLFPKPQ